MSRLDELLYRSSGITMGGYDPYAIANTVSTTQELRMARELFEQERAFQLEQQRLQREYDTPQAQRERYEIAGFNPYWQNISAGSYGSAIESSLTDYPQRTSGMQKPTEGLFNDLLGIVNVASATVDAISQMQDFQYQRQLMKDHAGMSKIISEEFQEDKDFKKTNTILMNVLKYLEMGTRAVGPLFGGKGTKTK